MKSSLQQKKVVHSGKAIKQKLNNTTNTLEEIQEKFVWQAKNELLIDFLTVQEDIVKMSHTRKYKNGYTRMK